MTNENVSDLSYADTLWKAADALRGQVDAAEYKHVNTGRENDDGVAGSWQATAPIGNIRRGELREAHRGRSKAEFIAKCGDSLRELEETAYWLELLVDAEIVAAAKMQPLRNECNELTAIFVTIIKKAREGRSPKAEG